MNSDHISDNKEPPKKHIWIMLICCLAPLFGIIALSSFGIIGSWGFFALILLCPILHLLLMRAIYRAKEQRRLDDYESKAN
jgi:uncharacterized membrane protein YdjX (TVP38/TMEM64 family)